MPMLIHFLLAKKIHHHIRQVTEEQLAMFQQQQQQQLLGCLGLCKIVVSREMRIEDLGNVQRRMGSSW